MKRERIFSEAEIEAIHLEALKNDAYGEFINDALILAKEQAVVGQTLPRQMADFEAKVKRVQQAMLIIEASQLSADIQENTAKREKAQTALKAMFRAAMGMPDEAVAQAGERLMKLAHDYEAHTGGKTDEQTKRISEWLKDMKENYWADVQRVGAETLYEQLDIVNERVCDLVLQKVKEDADRVVKVVKEARAECNAAYRELVKGVNAMAYVNGAEAYADFIKFMNSLIDRYKRLHIPGSNVTTPEADPDDLIDGDEVVGEEGGETTIPGGSTGGGTGSTGGSGSTGGGSGSTGGGTELTPDDESNDELTAATGITVKWTYNRAAVPEGSLLAKEMIVAPGTIIPASEWPEAHPGYHWNSTPEQMNDSVPYKRPGEWYYVREQPDEEATS